MRNKQHWNEYMRSFNFNNRERLTAKARKKYKENPEKIKAYNAKYRASHKDQLRVLIKKWYESNKEHVKDYYLRKIYGITLKQYFELSEKQHNACAICDVSTKLYVDHDHTTGTIRGLLCRICNVGLGHFCDSAVRLEAAASYLRR